MAGTKTLFFSVLVPLPMLGNASVPAGYLLIAALSKNKRAIVGRRRCFFGSGEL